MTQPEIDALVLRVGITPEKFPEFWGEACELCDRHYGHDPDCRGEYIEYCNLPDPASDDPRAVLWEPFLMRALGWPEVSPKYGGGYIAGRTEWLTSEESIWSELGTGPTPTAALLAAYQAKEAADATH